MIIYGKNVIKEAILSKRPIYKMYLDEKFSDTKFIAFLNNHKIEYVKLNKGELNRLTDQGIHQGVVADVLAYKTYELTDILRNDVHQRFLILDEIQDPHNLGAIMRSAEATKVDGIIMAKKHQVPLNGVVAKTSSGAIEHVPVIIVSNLYQTIEKLKQANVWVVGTSGDAETDFRDIPTDRSLAIVVGNEGDGMRELIKRGCDQLVRIPMFGKVNSLNVSVATALMLYQTLKY